jgi:acyl-CoA reductase-like NAD-dependent aldehyde dehydrogenase
MAPSSDSKINVIDSHSEQVFLTVAEAQAADMDRAVTAAKEAFDRIASICGERIVRVTLELGGKSAAVILDDADIESTVFGNVDNSSAIAQEEIFGPVLSVIPADDEADAVRIANDTIYGLHGAVFTSDVDRAREVAGQMRTGAIGHNGFKSDFDMGHGGFKQSGIGREGGIDGLLPFLESKAMLLDGPTAKYSEQ